MPVTHIPKFPVVKPEPSVGDAFSNLNFHDIWHIGAFTAAGYAVGWFGARPQFRKSNSRFLFGIGLMAGLFYACQSSKQRFMGLEENESEVARYGVATAEELARVEKKCNTPNINLVDWETGK